MYNLNAKILIYKGSANKTVMHVCAIYYLKNFNECLIFRNAGVSKL